MTTKRFALALALISILFTGGALCLDGSIIPRTYSGTYSMNLDGSGTAQYTTSNGTNHTRNLEIVNKESPSISL